ncbi:MAG TPA: RNA polymerase sigma factor [Polyangia bacterium]
MHTSGRDTEGSTGLHDGKGGGGQAAQYLRRLLAEVGERHGRALQRWTILRGGSAAEAADLMQEAFERALRTEPSVTTQEELRAWLQIVIRRLFIDGRRSTRWRGWVDADLDRHAAPAPEAMPLWRQAEVGSALKEIAPRLRVVVELQAAGRSLREISEELRIPIATVSTRLFRARHQLRRHLAVEIAPDELAVAAA